MVFFGASIDAETAAAPPRVGRKERNVIYSITKISEQKKGILRKGETEDVFMREKRASLKDVAELAGVNFTLVSKYLNHNPQARMSAETQARIDQAIRQLNYRPSAIARSLRSGRSHTIGFISSNLTNPYNAHLVDLALRLARARDYQLLIALNDMGKGDAELIERLFESGVDGILLSASIVLTVRPPCPASIYDGSKNGIYHTDPDITKPLREAIQSTPGPVGGLFFLHSWDKPFNAVAAELGRKSCLLHCPMPLDERIQAIRFFLETHHPALLITNGWHTLSLLTSIILPQMDGYHPRIVCHANCTGPFFDDPHVEGVIFSSTTDMIHHSLGLLIDQIENHAPCALWQTIPASYIPASAPQFKKMISAEFHLT